MFRSSIRRLAGPASAVRTTSVLSQTRLPLRQINTKSSLGALQARIASREIKTGFRFYSTESAAAPEEDVTSSVAPNEPVESFKDLHKLGVHRTLTDAIVKDMGFEAMTPVQAKTINPALKGTDMYV
jgi:ATP-dependent RNA helicase MSS116